MAHERGDYQTRELLDRLPINGQRIGVGLQPEWKKQTTATVNTLQKNHGKAYAGYGALKGSP